MSKNSAGKIYFVLYLAVILELLIIIVERDEAEERLRKREREAREIVQDILGQMQVGRGDENLTSRITDEITLLSERAIKISGIPYKRYRTYSIEVGVNDGNAAVTLGVERKDTVEYLQALKQLANVQDVRYEVLYSSSRAAELPLADDPAVVWKTVAQAELRLDTSATQTWQQPVYRSLPQAASVDLFAPPVSAGEPFSYNQRLTELYAQQNGGKLNKRFFTVHFQPAQVGWYKLRFTSKTNRIMGVSGDARSVEDISDDAKINIGSMQLTVKKLRKVQQLLARELESFGVPSLEQLIQAQTEEQVQAFLNQLETAKAAVTRELSAYPVQARDVLRKVDVYADITKLLSPNKSSYFAQNHGSMEINIRVTEPPVDIPTPALSLPPEIAYFDCLAPAFTLSASPFYGDNIPQGQVIDDKGKVYPLSVRRIGQEATARNVLGQGENATFMAETLEPLRPGRYRVVMQHKAQGEVKVDSTTLYVFSSVLKNKGILENRLKSLAFGSTLLITAIPDCDDRVPANQFRVYAALNTQPASTFTTGLTAKLPLLASARSASIRVTWISPYTGKEGELLSPIRGDMKQREPDIDVSRAAITAIRGDSEELTLEVSGISISPAVIDVGKTGGIETIDNVGLQAVSVDGVPMTVEAFDLKEVGSADDGTILYKAVFKLHGQSSKKPVELQGVINFSVLAAMRNPLNGVRSQTSSASHSLMFTYTTPAKKGKSR
jgi:hypothetical protein